MGTTHRPETGWGNSFYTALDGGYTWERLPEASRTVKGVVNLASASVAAPSKTVAAKDYRVAEAVAEAIPVGWLCPNCRTIYNPSVKECLCYKLASEKEGRA